MFRWNLSSMFMSKSASSKTNPFYDFNL